MPLIEDKKEQVGFARAIGVPDFEVDGDVPFKELLRAAYRTENTLGSLVALNDGMPDSVINNESFNPFDHISEDEKLDSTFTSNIALADTEQEINQVRSQQRRERKDRQLLATNGADSFFATMIAGGADVINYIPVGGTVYASYRTGASILRSAAATASVAAGTQAAVEAALHHTQIERTYGESALNVGAAAFLGGVLGGGASALKMSADRKLLAEIRDSLDPEPKVKAGENSVLPREGPDSVGAARVDQDVRVMGKIARGLTKVLGWDPLSGSITSSEGVTRSIAVELAENPIMM